MKRLLLFAAAVVVAAAQTTPVLTRAEIEQLETKVAQGSADRASQKLLGKNYGYYILGITSLKQYDRPGDVDPARASSDFADHARRVLLETRNSVVAGEGGYALWNLGMMVDRSNSQTLGVQALDRAILLEPEEPEWRKYRIPMVVMRTRFDDKLKLTPAAAYAKVREDLTVLKGEDRGYMLASAAKLALQVNALDDAKSDAEELLTYAPAGGWNSGNATFFGNMVLGEVALRRGDRTTAKDRLLESGKTKGSPQLNSFGPNMTLAKDLLAAGDRDTVLEYLTACRAFWKMGEDKLDSWSKEIAEGKTPDFGVNLAF